MGCHPILPYCGAARVGWDERLGFLTKGRGISDHALAALPVTQASVERFSAMRLLLLDLRSLLKRDAIEAMLLVRTSMI